MALSFFTLQTWVFVNTNFLALNDQIPELEKKDFDFDLKNIDAEDTFKNVVIGSQKYLFKTNPKKIGKAKRKLKKLVGYWNVIIIIK